MTHYTITPTDPTDLKRCEMQLTFGAEATLSDIQRGAGLAGALQARSVRHNATAWILTPGRARKWEALFKAGFIAFNSGDRQKFRRNYGESFRLWQAIDAATMPTEDVL